MPFRCSIRSCKAKHDSEKNYSFYKLPAKSKEQQNWINSIPYFKEINTSLTNFRVYGRHWPVEIPMKTVPGRFKRTKLPPSVFNIPSSCQPTQKAPARKKKIEIANQSYFDKNDKFNTFRIFLLESTLAKKYYHSIKYILSMWRFP